eukprot:2882650-Amphidinium_carterae.1
MEQAMAVAKAKNASMTEGMMSRSEEIELNADGPRPVVKPPPPVPPKKPPPPFFESPYRSEDEEPTGLRVMSPGEPIPHGKMVMSPSMPMQDDDVGPTEDRVIATALAAKQAAAVIARAKEEAFPSTPKAKPGPKGFEWVPTTGK